MGKRGPAPTPTALRILRGETKPSRVNRDEPKPPAEPLVCPDDVRDEVRDVWDYTLKNIRAMKLEAPTDRDALLAYCEAVVVHRRASRALATEDLTAFGTMGGIVVNPNVRIQRDAANQIRQYAREFGLTPSARSEIRTSTANGGKSDADSDPARYLTA